jgi:hypothetical protein
MQREIFGPILPLLAYRELDEVIAPSTPGRGRWPSTPSATDAAASTAWSSA